MCCLRSKLLTKAWDLKKRILSTLCIITSIRPCLSLTFPDDDNGCLDSISILTCKKTNTSSLAASLSQIFNRKQTSWSPPYPQDHRKGKWHQQMAHWENLLCHFLVWYLDSDGGCETASRCGVCVCMCVVKVAVVCLQAGSNVRDLISGPVLR